MELSKILQASGMRSDFIARQLFPNNKHPYNAMNRLLAGSGELKASQLKTLAGLLNTSVDALLEQPVAPVIWSGSKITGRGGLVLKSRGFTVSFDSSLPHYYIEKQSGFMSSFPSPPGLTVREFLANVEIEILRLS